MNNIRFRAWHKELQKMAPVTDIAWLDDTLEVSLYSNENEIALTCTLDEIELMQSTGLKSKDDVEIFEGDILDVCPHLVDKRNQRLYHVKYDVINAAWHLRNVGEPFKDMLSWYKFCEAVTERSVVIGNLFENPELLGGVHEN